MNMRKTAHASAEAGLAQGMARRLREWAVAAGAPE
ncbi:MAG: hypothetical protein RL434_233, partial [Pseudomonadota bacterium]